MYPTSCWTHSSPKTSFFFFVKTTLETLSLHSISRTWIDTFAWFSYAKISIHIRKFYSKVLAYILLLFRYLFLMLFELCFVCKLWLSNLVQGMKQEKVLVIASLGHFLFNFCFWLVRFDRINQFIKNLTKSIYF